MKPARERHGHPVVADAVTAEAEAAMAGEAEAGTVVVAATVASEEATNSGTIRELKFARKPSRAGLGRAGFEPAKA
jgi:hypothetical protein